MCEWRRGSFRTQDSRSDPIGYDPQGSTTATVTVILTTLDNVVLRVHKGSFSSPIECTSDTGGSKEECSVTMSALDTSIYMEVVNDNTVFGTPFTIWVH
jgi:hypothetical protein